MAVLAFFAGPIGRWLVVIALVATSVVSFGIYERTVQHAKDVDAESLRRAKEEKAWLAVMARRGAAFAALQAAQDQLTNDHEKALQAQDAKRLADIEKLKKEMPKYATDSSAVCPALPVGYVVYRGNVAAYANGIDSRAPEPPTQLAETASRFSLTDLSGLDADQASAYKACRERVTGWEQYSDQVDAWAAKVNIILKGATP